MSKAPKYIAIAAVALIAVATTHPKDARAQGCFSFDASGSHPSECGAARDSAAYGAPEAVATLLQAQFVHKVILNPIADCWRRDHGRPGAYLGPVENPSFGQWLSAIAFGNSNVTPAGFDPMAKCSTTARVASAAEIHAANFAALGLDPARAAVAAVKVYDVAGEWRKAETARYLAAIADESPRAMVADARQ